MNTNVKFHKSLPIGMVEGNKYRVWLKNGKELTIQQSKKYGPYVRFRTYGGMKFITISKLYNEIFSEKRGSSAQTIFSKRDLMNQNRKGTYLPSMNARVPIISMSGYILRGADKGRHLRDLSVEKISWYVDNHNLNANEMVEVDRELKRRENGRL